MSKKEKNIKSGIFGLTLAALGVVYGDIGTSPLYAVNQIFFGKGGSVINGVNILGSISMIIYFLTIVVAIKYVVFVLQANNEGEGGVLALFAILSNYKEKLGKWIIPFTLAILMLAAGLLFGDGLITPAISVLSSIEGLSIITPSFQPFIIPITLILLFILFFFQHKGTSKVGKIFGPIIVAWFLAIAIFGFRQVLLSPSILKAFNPYYLIYFIFHTKFSHLIVVIGFAMLAITGGEALYADMGHFGEKPIRIGWFSLVYPALLLNYLGQGAYLLSGAPIHQGDIFYSLVPAFFLFPMIILATMATIIASQALISGAFSLASQASTLGIAPMLRKVYTDEHQEGQIYISFINWALCAGCLLLVIIFKSSNNLASAYGLAVAGVMLATSLAMILVARLHWKWKMWKIYLIFIPFVVIDLSFFASNFVKFFQGGIIPFAVGFSLWGLMNVWQWGRNIIHTKYNAEQTIKISDLLNSKKNSFTEIPKTMLFMGRDFTESKEDFVPISFQIFWDRFNIIPKNLLFLNVEIQKVPHMKDKRFEIVNFNSKNGCNISSVKINFGYWEQPNVEKVLNELSQHHMINIDENPEKWLFYIVQERVLIAPEKKNFWTNIRFEAFKFLSRNSDTADHYFGLGKEIGLSTETLPVYLK